MAAEHHQWRVGGELPPIRPHSQAKHKILRAYLEKYVDTLTRDVRRDQLRITLVDGFAGGGIYQTETGELWSGSPLIILEAMKKAEAEAQSRREKEFKVSANCIFIEKDKQAFAHLKKVIEESDFRIAIGDSIQLLNGTFADQVDRTIKAVKQHGNVERAIFFLDQCGYKDVPFDLIRKILDELENAEVILNIAIDSLIDYLSDDEATQRRLENIGLVLPRSEIQTAKEMRQLRKTIQQTLHTEIYERSGAKFYTPFFTHSRDSHRDHWLLHLSKHQKAKAVMLDLHWQLATSFAHYGGSGLRMLGYDVRDGPTADSQLRLPGYFFDETARTCTIETLMDQLPERIFDAGEGISFEQLFASTTNEMPANIDILKDVIHDLFKEKIVTVRNAEGTTQRRAGVQKSSDIIVPTRQTRFL